MSKVYITSKSKTFRKGIETFSITSWVLNNVEKELSGKLSLASFKSKQKYKITITNLK